MKRLVAEPRCRNGSNAHVTSYSGGLPFAMAALAWSIPGMAAAQQVPGTPPSTEMAHASTAGAAARSAVISDEIVVTAQRRKDRLQDVPQAVTAFSAQSLQRLGITTTEALVRNVPGLSFTPVSPTESTLSLRGLSTDLGLVPTVAVYVNDTPLDFRSGSSSGSPNIDLFDLERVEILRGPQGTLFGSSSLGGTIRYILKSPELNKFSYNVETGVNGTSGGKPGYEAKGVVNIPVASIAALRLVGTYEHIGGYIDRYAATETGLNSDPSTDRLVKKSANGVDVYSLRATALLEPTDDLRITPSIFFQRATADGSLATDTNLPSLGHATAIGPEPTRSNLLVTNLTVEKDWDFANLVSSSSYLHKKSFVRRDFSLFGLSYFGQYSPISDDTPQSVDAFVQEIRLSSPGHQRLRWVAGFYFSHNRQNLDERFTGQEFSDLLVSLDAPSDNTSSAYDYRQLNTDQQIAGFAQINYDLLPKLELIAGGRVYNLKNKVSATCTDATADRLLCGPDAAPASGSTTDASPRATINFKPSRNATLYATVSRGFRQGGANTAVPASLGCVLPVPQVFKPDTVWNYELGAKLQSSDQRLTANGAVFRLDQSDVQLAIPDPVCGFISYQNAGKVRVKGAELEMSARPFRALSLSGQLSYTDARFSQVPSAFGAAAGYAVGDPAPETPRWKYGVSGEYTQPMLVSWTGYLRADWQHVGRIPYSSDDGVFSGFYRPSYDIVGMQVGARDSRYEINLFVRNLFNEKAILSRSFGTTSSIRGVYESDSVTQPRTIGLTLRVQG